jgi:hypothetical protein
MKQDPLPLLSRVLYRPILAKLDAWRLALQRRSIGALVEMIAARAVVALRGRLHRFEEPTQAVEPLSFPFSQPDESGWIRHADLTAAPGQSLCELGGIVLGTAPDLRAAPDLLAALEAANAYSRLMDIESGQGVSLRGHGKEPVRTTSNLAHSSDLVLKCPGIPLEFIDAWFANDLDLVMRAQVGEVESDAALVVRFFQYDEPAQRLRILAEHALRPRNSNLIDVPTLNPLLPILICVAGRDGDIRHTSLLPFPSLCRGGLHYGELLGSAGGSNVWASLQPLSVELVGSWLADKPGHVIERIEVDIADAVGSERIFQPLVQDWLAAFLIPVAPIGRPAANESIAQRYLENNLRVLTDRIRRRVLQSSRQERRGLLLRLPAGALPSLQCIVARSPLPKHAPDASQTRFIVADEMTANPKWLVEMPAVDEKLLAVQPANSCTFPSLASPESASASAIGAPFPLSIHFRDFSDQDAALLIMPFVAEATAPLIPRTDNDTPLGSGSTSVIFPYAGSIGFFAAFLDSLKFQVGCENIEIIVGLSPSQGGSKPRVVELLNASFWGRARMLEYPEELSATARLNALAAGATGDFIVVAGEPVLLHDCRTLAMLRVLVASTKIACASCLLIHSERKRKGAVVRVRSGGYYLSSTGMPDAASLRLSLLDGAILFPRATYAVVANSASLFMTRRKVWARLNGLDATNPDPEAAVIDYGLRAAAGGFTNYCTTAVSAMLPQPARGDGLAEVSDVAAKLGERRPVTLRRLVP